MTFVCKSSIFSIAAPPHDNQNMYERFARFENFDHLKAKYIYCYSSWFINSILSKALSSIFQQGALTKFFR